MNHYQGIVIGFVAVCALLLLLTAINKKSELLLTLVCRLVVGSLLICFGNMGVAFLGLSGGVGINLTTLLTSTILGFWGVAALFGIFFCGALS